MDRLTHCVVFDVARVEEAVAAHDQLAAKVLDSFVQRSAVKGRISRTRNSRSVLGS